MPPAFLAESVQVGYRAEMSVFLRQILRFAAQKASSNPEVREKVVKAARGVVDEAKQIAKEDDRAYAAGRAFRKALDKLRSDQ